MLAMARHTTVTPNKDNNWSNRFCWPCQQFCKAGALCDCCKKG
jgi:hypothetical protein